MSAVAYKDPIGAHHKAGIPVEDRTWEDITVEGEGFGNMIFHRCTFRRVRWTGCGFSQTMFVKCEFEDCTIEDSRIDTTQWVECTGTGWTVIEGETIRMTIAKGRLGTVRFATRGEYVTIADSSIETLTFDRAGTEQKGMTISGVKIRTFNAHNARWNLASLIEVDLAHIALESAVLERCALIRARGEKTDLSAIVFKECNMYQSELGGATIRNAAGSVMAECGLEGANFDEAMLEGTLMHAVRARGASFVRARMRGAICTDADMREADLTAADARRTAWHGTNLTSAVMDTMEAEYASFRNADLTGASVEGADFTHTDLHRMKGDVSAARTHGARATVEERARIEEAIRERSERQT